jgi:hypothetical protein
LELRQILDQGGEAVNKFIYILFVVLFFLVAICGLWLSNENQRQICVDKCGDVETIYNATGCYCRYKETVLKL